MRSIRILVGCNIPLALFVRPEVKPVRQPTRRLSDDRRQVVLDELTKLLAAGFIMEVLHGCRQLVS